MKQFALLTFSLVMLAQTPISVKASDSLDVGNISIFDDLIVKPTQERSSMGGRRVQRTEWFGFTQSLGLKKGITYAMGAVAGTMALSAVYPPAVPFILWSLKTKIITGTCATMISGKIVHDFARARCNAIEKHNQIVKNGGYQGDSNTYPLLQELPFYPFFAFSIVDRVLWPIGLGIGLGFVGLGLNIYSKS